MVKIREAIVVEGRYDKNTLSQVVDAPILETAGFGIFKDRQQMALLRHINEKYNCDLQFVTTGDWHSYMSVINSQVVNGEKIAAATVSYTAANLSGDGLMIKKGKKVYHRAQM